MDDIVLPTVEIHWPDTPSAGGTEDQLSSPASTPTIISQAPPATEHTIHPIDIHNTVSYYHSYYAQVQQALIDQVYFRSPSPQEHPFAPGPSSPPTSPSPFRLPRHIPLPTYKYVSVPVDDWVDPEEHTDVLGLYGSVNITVEPTTPVPINIITDLPGLYGLTYRTPGLLFDYGQPSTYFDPDSQDSKPMEFAKP